MPCWCSAHSWLCASCTQMLRKFRPNFTQCARNLCRVCAIRKRHHRREREREHRCCLRVCAWSRQLGGAHFLRAQACTIWPRCRMSWFKWAAAEIGESCTASFASACNSMTGLHCTADCRLQCSPVNGSWPVAQRFSRRSPRAIQSPMTSLPKWPTRNELLNERSQSRSRVDFS